MQKKDGEPDVKDRLSYHPASPPEDTLADYLKNVNSDFEGKPKIVEEASPEGNRLTIENPATEEVLSYLSNRDSSSMTGSPERRLAAYRFFVEKQILKFARRL